MPSKFVDSITKLRGDMKKYMLNCKKLNNNYLINNLNKLVFLPAQKY